MTPDLNVEHQLVLKADDPPKHAFQGLIHFAHLLLLFSL